MRNILITALLSFAILACGRANDGLDGRDGTICVVQGISSSEVLPYGGAIITCGDTNTLISNGMPGVNGQDAPHSAYVISEIINPCGKESTHDEVILRLANGALLAHYSHGNKQFLTELTQGNYITTDGTNCNFSVDANKNVSW